MYLYYSRTATAAAATATATSTASALLNYVNCLTKKQVSISFLIPQFRLFFLLSVLASFAISSSSSLIYCFLLLCVTSCIFNKAIYVRI